MAGTRRKPRALDRIVVLLGHTNTNPTDSSLPQLSSIAAARADEAVKVLTQPRNRGWRVIPTGAFGKRFNESHVAHGELLRQYLICKGIARTRILPHTVSSNTLEDAFGVLLYLKGIGQTNAPDPVREILLVTSKYHMPRASYIFSRVLPNQVIIPICVENPEEDEDGNTLKELEGDERDKLKFVKRNWVDIGNLDLSKFPVETYKNAGYELRHYDMLSYFTIVGAMVLFSVFMSDELMRVGNEGLKSIEVLLESESVLTERATAEFVPYAPEAFDRWMEIVQYPVEAVLIYMVGYLYQRFAGTARRARNVMDTVEMLYRSPGLSNAGLHQYPGPFKTLPWIDRCITRCASSENGFVRWTRLPRLCDHLPHGKLPVVKIVWGLFAAMLVGLILRALSLMLIGTE